MPAKSPTANGVFLPLALSMIVVVAGALLRIPERAQWWLVVLFQGLSWATLAVFWLRTTRWDATSLALALGVFLCLVSFGPAYSSNTNALANHVTTVWLDILPPLKSIREFNRIWIFGVLSLSVYATIQLSAALRGHAASVQAGAALAVIGGTLLAVYERPLAASPAIEAPPDFVKVAQHSQRQGAIYVHSDMTWNSTSGVLMIASARLLKRPIVNGHMGINPPWFAYAANVLHRFPDPEALWLLRKWNVDTVISRVPVDPPSGSFVKVFEDGGLAVWDVASRGVEIAHPSAAPCRGTTRAEAAWTAAQGGLDAIAVKVPPGLQVGTVEIHFRGSVVSTLPASIGVYGSDGTSEVRINQQRSGDWIESLAADSLVRRKPTVASIAIAGTPSTALRVELGKSGSALLDRVVLCGETAGGTN